MNIKLNKNIVAVAFLIVPIFASVMSTIHLVDLFKLGNPTWMAYFLAITFEIGSISSFIALSVMHKIKKWIVWFIFIVLFFEQLFGNIYSTFDYINVELGAHPTWLASFTELVKPIYSPDDPNTYKFILALIIGAFIPMISLAFLKSMVDYLDASVPDTPAKPEVAEVKVQNKPAAKNGKEDDEHIAPWTNHDM